MSLNYFVILTSNPSSFFITTLKTVTVFILFSLVIFSSYSNTINSSWQFDDKPNILTNPAYQITNLTPSSLWGSFFGSPGAGHFYRPIAGLSLAINWYFGQDKVAGYHLFNITTHILTSWFLYLTLCSILNTSRLTHRYSGDQKIFIAFLATLFWALNPIQTQAITYIVQRMAALATLFSILSIYCYLRGRLNKKHQLLYFVLSIVAYLFATFSKENAAILPLSLLIIEIIFFPKFFDKITNQKIILGLITSFFLLFIFATILSENTFSFITNHYNSRTFTLLERLLTEQRVIVYYLSLLFFPSPSRLSIEHDFAVSTSLISPPTTLLSIFFIVLLIVFSIKKYQKYPVLSFAILFFFLNHFIESSIIPLELVFEHRNYLPSLFLFFPVAQGLQYFLEKTINNRPFQMIMLGFIICILFIEGFATFTRNRVWATEQSLWLDAMIKAPNQARPPANLATLLAWNDSPSPIKYRAALRLYEKALTLQNCQKNFNARILGNIGSIYLHNEEYEKAISFYQNAILVDPNNIKIQYDLIKPFIFTGNFRQANEIIDNILKAGYIHADYFDMKGFIGLWLSEPTVALNFLEKAYQLDPQRADIVIHLGRALTLNRLYDQADQTLKLIWREGANISVSLCLIENALMQEQENKAKYYLKKLLSINSFGEIKALLSNSTNQYNTIPLSNAMLNNFITRESHDLEKIER